MFKKVDSKFDLPKTEEGILEFWDKNKTFRRSLENRKDAPLYRFFDGPPFATGTPHYGHIVGSTMKDVVPRYWTMRGYYVERTWGWDCHGLPIENIAEKSLKFQHKKDIIDFGVDKFNDFCRSKVLDYVKEWEIIIRRLGRWADMENCYRTMDLSYMESVWWVFKQLWERGLIYEGYRSMHICPRCETTLSQSEVSEGYKDIKDLSVIGKFELTEEPNTFIVAWTTTPWTLIGNVALAVGEKITYVKVKSGDSYYILAENTYDKFINELPGGEIVEKFKGSTLVGKSYKPLFDYYSRDKKIKNWSNGWKVCAADFVSTDEGTGVVHIAPAFGEDDMNLGRDQYLPFIQHVGMDGVIKKEAGEFAGLYVKPSEDVQQTDLAILKNLASRGLLFHKEQYLHSYPHCWRCDTPLINYATSSWFVNITKIKGELLETAKDINWSPSYIKKGRFGNWLEGARDWSISRQRFWASVIPIWRCEDCGEMQVMGSAKELEDASGTKVTDLHKHIVDHITFKCKKCGGTMTRVPDVLDTWFDSGSMPYAQLHYPFENEEKFDNGFPADFIAEGEDQTRAWFYYLHVIATAIKENKAYKNVIVNGTVLAEDGKKMSKRLMNYPDPALMFEKYGADPMRFYLMSSPVVQAENLNFSESEIADISRGMFRMLWNSYSFFVLYANIDNWSHDEKYVGSQNVLDKWILSELNTLTKNVNSGMEKYDLAKTARLFPKFIDNLSNWYIRRSRKRFWKSESDIDKNCAYETLYFVLVELSKLMAPFTPFISEEIYKNLTGEESVHLADFPQHKKDNIDEKLNNLMAQAREIVELGLAERSKLGIKVRQPLQSITYHGSELSSDLTQIIIDEVNVKEAIFSEGDENAIELDSVITPKLQAEGYARELIRNIQALRKSAGFEVENRVRLNYYSDSDNINKMLDENIELIAHEVLAEEVNREKNEKVESFAEYTIGDGKVWIGLSRIK